jgi:glycine/D-amino acid oxidase-like deaminating enzyme
MKIVVLGGGESGCGAAYLAKKTGSGGFSFRQRSY